MITNDRHKLEKFKQKSSFRIAMAVFVLITILLNLPSSVNCINNKSVEENAETLVSATAGATSFTATTTTTTPIEEYKNTKLHRIQTPEATEHRSLELEHSRSLEIEHRSLMDETEHQKIFTPRFEYNSWQPVGRGDPLKNDPTYDYSPPVVEPVRYWAENTKTENPANSLTNKKDTIITKDKNEILILGVPAKRQNYRKESKYIGNEPSSDSYKQQSYNIQDQNQHHQTTQQQLQGTIRRSYSYGHSYHNLPTRLMPPPMQTIAPPSTILSGNKLMPATTEAYHHTYHHHYSVMPSTIMTYTTNNKNGVGSKSNSGTNIGSYFQYSPSLPGSNQQPWIYNKMPFDAKNSESINYVSITKPEANGLVQSIPPSSSGSINIKQPHFKRKPWIHELLSKEITKSPPLMEGTNYVSHLIPSKIPLPSPSPPLIPSSTSSPSPPPQSPPNPQPSYMHQSMNTIKPIQVSTTNGFVPMVTTRMPTKTTNLLLLSSTPSKKPNPSSTTTFKPIIITTSPTYLHSTTTKTTTTNYPSKPTTTTIFTTIASTTTTLRPKPIQYTPSMKSHKITTPVNELTTDALFSHYKQPEKPLFGPLYLIIEGHSKVKTYGLKDNDTNILHQPKIVPIEVTDRDNVVKKHVVLKDENGQAIEIKHLHNKKTELKEENSKSEQLKNNRIEQNETETPISLLSFLGSSFGGLFSSVDDTVVTDDKQNNNNLNLTIIKEKLNENEMKSSMIFVTTITPPISDENNTVTKTTVLEPIKSALIQEPKEQRQVFDYDQFDKPSIFDFFNTGEEYPDYEELTRDNNNNNERENLNSESLEDYNNERNMELNTSEIRIG